MIPLTEFIKSIWGYISKQQITYFIPYIVIILMVVFYFNEKATKEQKENETIALNKALADSTIQKIDELGRKFSQTSVLRATDPKTLLAIKSKDASIIKLQKEVKRLKGSMTAGSSVTQFTDKLHIDVPTVNGKFSDKWVGIDNSSLNRSVIDVKNNYSVDLIQKNGEYLAQIRNDNPYSTKIDTIRTFVEIPKTPPDRKFSVGVGIGYNAKGEILPSINIQYKLFNLPF